MKKKTILILLYIVCISQSIHLAFSDEGLDLWKEADNLIRESIDEISVLSDKYPDDLEIQLGLAYLYNRYGTPKVVGKSFSEQSERVFQIDPNNKPLHSLLAIDLCKSFSYGLNYEIVQLDRIITSAIERGANEIEIMDDSPLREWFSETDECVVGKNPYGSLNGEPYYAYVITDFDLARKELKQKVDEKNTGKSSLFLSQINKAQSIDPDNALYNYLKGYIYLRLNKEDEGVRELKEGVTKKFFSTFQEDLAKAEEKVLIEADFPKKYRDILISVREPFEDFAKSKIWIEGLSIIEEEYEANGDNKNAEDICLLTIEIAQQIQKEQIYRSLGLDNIAQNRINALSSIENSNQDIKIIAQNKFPTKKPLDVTLPIAGVSLAVVVVTFMIMFLRKKKPKKAE